MNGQLPLISIVITNFNYGQFLSEAIESALGQTYPRTEVILIDDASTDDSRDVYQRFSGLVDFVEHADNEGIVFSRNEALRIVKGDYLCFLDADDYWDVDFLQQMYNVASESGADVVYPDWRLFGDINEIRSFPEFDPILLQLQKIHCTAESLLRLSSVRQYTFEPLDVAEDWDFFIKLSLEGLMFKHADNCLINYRIKHESRTTAGDEIEVIRQFVTILEKFKTTYGDRVIEPLELVLSKIDDKNRLIAAIAERNQQLQDDILAIQRSRSFKLGSALTKPLRILRDIRKHKFIAEI